MDSLESRPAMVAEQISPALSDMIRHNQAQWRARNKSLNVLSSPVEIPSTIWVFGSDPFENIVNVFGPYIYPSHRYAPPLIGLSVFQDIPEGEKGAWFWVLDSPSYNEETSAFNEAKVHWLTNVANRQNPVKPRFSDAVCMEPARMNVYKRFIRACDDGLSPDELTDAFARHHFQGDNRKLDTMFPRLFPEKHQSFDEYIRLSVQESRRFDASDPFSTEGSDKTSRISVPSSKAVRQLSRVITQFPFVGSARIPGIINIEVKADLLLIGATLFFAQQMITTGVSLAFPLFPAVGFSEMLFLLNKNTAAIHELIHAMGITETHKEGFPAVWKKLRI